MISSYYCDNHRAHRQHRVAVKKHLGEGSVSTRVEKVLALLVESGFVYCCLWVRITASESTRMCWRRITTSLQILYMVSAYDVFPYQGFTVMDSSMFLVAVSQRAGAPRVPPDTESPPRLQGAYPTLIVVLVCMQKSPVDHYSVHCSTRMQFVANSPNLPALSSARI
jgi:hypothetical protein